LRLRAPSRPWSDAERPGTHGRILELVLRRVKRQKRRPESALNHRASSRRLTRKAKSKRQKPKGKTPAEGYRQEPDHYGTETAERHLRGGDDPVRS
jgi:hypothetical protein